MTRLRPLKISAASFSFCTFQSFSIAAYPFLASELHLSLGELISAFATGSLFFLPANPFWSFLCSKYKPGTILKTGLFVLLLSQGILLTLILKVNEIEASYIFPLLLLSRIIYGSFCSAIVPASGIILTSGPASPHQGVKNVSGHFLGQNAGRITGPVILFIFGSSSMSAPLIILLSLGFVVWLLLFTESSGVPESPPATGTRPGNDLIQKIKSLPDGSLCIAFVALFLSFGFMYIQSGIGDTVISISTQGSTDPKLFVSLLYISGTFIAISSQLWLKAKTPKPYGPWCSLISILMIAAIALLICSPGLSGLWTGYLLFMICHSLIYPTNLASMIAHRPEDSSLIFAGFGIIHGIGYGLGSFTMAMTHQSDSLYDLLVLSFVGTGTAILITMTQKSSHMWAFSGSRYQEIQK